MFKMKNYYLDDEISTLITDIKESEEYVRLGNVNENNVVHDNESVTDHTKQVVGRVHELARELTQESLKAREYFKSKIGGYARLDLLVLSSWLHDIGKAETIVEDENGITSCPGHEKQGVKIAKKLLKGKLNNDARGYVFQVIKLHSGFSLRFMDYLMSLSKNKLKEALMSINFVPEISLFMIADNESAKVFDEYKQFLQETLLDQEEVYVETSGIDDPKELGKVLKLALDHLKSNSKPWPVDIRLFHLSEEVGELHDIYLQYIGAKDRDQDITHITGALNDTLFELLALYDIFGINIADAVKKEIKKENE